MSWRTIVISRRAKLEYSLGYMVVRGEKALKVFVDEISVLIIEHTGVSLTAALLVELSKRNIKVIFCNEKRNPEFEILPYYGNHDTSLKYKEQISWSKKAKENVWTEIVRAKIRMQKEHLILRGLEESKKLEQYLDELQHNDKTNREGHAARVYFNTIFGNGFTRSYDLPVNSGLNYGYSILLSCFNREIVSNGYSTQIGIFHDNMFNQYNLASDLMEPFRPLVDVLMVEIQPQKFEHEEKMQIVDLLNRKVHINDQMHFVNRAISIYCRSVFDALRQDDISLLRFYDGI